MMEINESIKKIISDNLETAISNSGLKKKVAFFDFDGTITNKDTLLEFLKFQQGSLKFWVGFLTNAFYIILFKLKLISNHSAKEKIFHYFWKEIDVDSFQRTCDNFVKEKLPGLVRPLALEEIKKLKSQNFEIIIVSASPHNWISSWAKSLDITVISTQLELRGQKLTGFIQGRNCHGIEKVNCIKARFNLDDYEEIVAYGDSKGDLPMMQLAHTVYYRPFR